MTTPAAHGYYMPAEWESHSRCWMAWPCREAAWRGGLEAAQSACSLVARAIAAFEPVTMVCAPADVADVSLACGSGVQVLPRPIDDSWLRDTGPSFLVDGRGGLAGVQWGFNGWGGKYTPHADDATIARRLLEHMGVHVFTAPMVLEGGAVQVDGQGTLLATESCLLHTNRNPGLDRTQIEEILKDWLGVNTIIWLGEGYQDDETDGHVDEVACFVRPGVVLALTTDDPADANFRVFHDNLDRLNAARDATGRALEVVTVRQPRRRDVGGVRLSMSYTNLYLANGGVVVPAFHDPADNEAHKTIQRLFPERTVVRVPALDIVRGGGGVHGITLGQPEPT